MNEETNRHPKYVRGNAVLIAAGVDALAAWFRFNRDRAQRLRREQWAEFDQLCDEA